MLRPYLKIWDWELIFGCAVNTISSLGVSSPWYILYHDYKNISKHTNNLAKYNNKPWFSVTLMNLLCFQLMLFDSQNAAIDVWDNSEGLPIAGAMIMIFLDIILYGLLAAWLDNILPTEYGTRRVPWFCFQPSYWVKQQVYIK